MTAPITPQPSKTDNEWLHPYRLRIDALDDEIIDLLAKRFEIVKEVGHLKTQQGLKIEQTKRVDIVKDRNAERAAQKNLSPDLIRQIYTIIIDHAHALEYDIKDDHS